MKNFLERCPDKFPKAASRIIDGEAVIVIPGKGIVNILNKVGTRTWELLDGKKGLRDIADIISDEFEVTPQEAIRDIKEFVNDLLEKGMVVLSGESNEQGIK